jgi:ATP-dependent Clp protease protease subunit
MKFAYAVNVDTDEPIMLLDKHIGYDAEDGQGIQGDLFQKELLALDQMNKKRIQVWINSPGGNVAEGYNINNAILRSKTPVDTYCIGIAASMAGVIFQSGRKRIMADYGILMYHNPYNPADKNEVSDMLGAYRKSLVTMVASKSGKTEDEVAQMMNKETWISAYDAKAAGFCDSIDASVDYNKKHWKQLVSSEDTRQLWKASANILNNIFQKNTDMSFKKVAARLKLVEDANEESIVSAIDSIENRASAAEARATAAAAELVTAKADLVAAQAKVTQLEVDAKAATEAAAASEKAALEVKAKAMVENFAKAGRIKNDAETVTAWTAKAVSDFDGTKKLIEGLPVNKVANKIEDRCG